MLPHLYSPFTKYFRKKQNKRLPEIVNYLIKNDFEIIVLQEVFDLSAIRKLKKKTTNSLSIHSTPN